MHIHETVFYLVDMDSSFVQANDRELTIIPQTYAYELSEDYIIYDSI